MESLIAFTEIMYLFVTSLTILAKKTSQERKNIFSYPVSCAKFQG